MSAVVAFWLVMSGLLIRLEIRPDQSGILDVPVSYVIHVMFSHGQQSLLTLQDSNADHASGSLSLRPYVSGTGNRAMDFSGNFVFQGLSSTRQSLSLSGTIGINKELQAQDYSVQASLKEPPFHVDVHGDVPRHLFRYQLTTGGQTWPAQILPLETSAIVPALFQQLGMDPTVMPIVQSNLAAPVLQARETRIALHGEPLEVYELSVRESGVSVADMYVSQLGQIILVKTSFGYNLSADDFR